MHTTIDPSQLAASAERAYLPYPRWAIASFSLWWLLSFVDSAWPQAQMAVFGNNVYFGSWLVHLLFLASVPALALTRAPIDRPAFDPPFRLIAVLAGFAAYLAVDLIFLEARYPDVGGSLVRTYYRYYALLGIYLIAYGAVGAVPVATMQRWLMIVFVPLALLGLSQYFRNDPILPTVASNGTFQVYAWWFQGDIRAFSLFNSGWSFGHFCAFIAALAILRITHGPNRLNIWIGLAILLTAIVCVYCSLTRTVYLVGLGTLWASALIARRPEAEGPRAQLLWLPPVFALVGYLVAYGIKDLLQLIGAQDDGIFSSRSLDYRHEAWDVWSSVWLSNGWSNALFGAGVTQRDAGQLLSESTVLIDNVFIAIGVQVGIVGVIAWIGVMFVIWTVILDRALARRDALALAIAAAWSTWPLSLMFGSGGNYYMLLAALLVLTDADAARRSRRSISVTR